MGAEGNTVQDSPDETMSLDKVEDLLEVPKPQSPYILLYCFVLITLSWWCKIDDFFMCQAARFDDIQEIMSLASSVSLDSKDSQGRTG